MVVKELVEKQSQTRQCLAEIMYFRFGRPYCYFRLSVVLAITFFELAMVENHRVQLETNKFVVLLLKLVWAFSPSATRVRKNTRVK